MRARSCVKGWRGRKPSRPPPSPWRGDVARRGRRRTGSVSVLRFPAEGVMGASNKPDGGGCLGLFIVFGMGVYWFSGVWAEKKDEWFPRWRDGDCFVLITPDGSPGLSVNRVLARAPNGEYL